MRVILPNARLSAVNAGGDPDSYRDDDPEGGAKWSTDEAGNNVYVFEQFGIERGLDENRLTRGRENQIRATIMVVPGEISGLVPGDVVHFIYHGDDQAREVWDVEPIVVLGETTHWNLTLEPA